MKTMKFYALSLLVLSSVMTFVSCNDDDKVWWYYPSYPNAMVTVKPVADGGFYMQLDDKTTLFPVNVNKSPYDDKEVRALVNYTEVENVNDDYTKSVRVNWIDSIRTKPAVPFSEADDDSEYGNDPIEIVQSWVNIAEDGYLTLCFRTRWGDNGVKHNVNLVTGTNPDDPYEVVFRHNAFGDVNGRWGDALVAFRLKDLPDTEGKTVRLTLKYKSYDGEKTLTFDYCSRESSGESRITDKPLYSSRVR